MSPTDYVSLRPGRRSAGLTSSLWMFVTEEEWAEPIENAVNSLIEQWSGSGEITVAGRDHEQRVLFTLSVICVDWRYIAHYVQLDREDKQIGSVWAWRNVHIGTAVAHTHAVERVAELLRGER